MQSNEKLISIFHWTTYIGLQIAYVGEDFAESANSKTRKTNLKYTFSKGCHPHHPEVQERKNTHVRDTACHRTTGVLNLAL